MNKHSQMKLAPLPALLQLPALLPLLTLLPLVSSHGFMYYPTPRNFKSATTNIDSLRNPTTEFCRDAPVSGKRTVLKSGKLDIVLAISKSAGHIGPCKFELWTSGKLEKVLAEIENCAVNDESSCDSPPEVPDSCLVTVSVTVPYIPSRPRAFIRFRLTANHNAPSNVEEYETCSDIEFPYTKESNGGGLCLDV